MEVDYSPSLPPRLGTDLAKGVENAPDQLSDIAEQPLRFSSAHKKSHKQHDVTPSSASDNYSNHSDEVRPASRPKKHADKSKHKSRARYVPSSSEEDQSSVPRHRSAKPYRAHSDQEHDPDQPQHDPDPPYYREVALSDVPSHYADEVDTFRSILKLPDPRESMPRSSTAVMGLDDEKGRQELRPWGPSSMLPLNSNFQGRF